MKNLKKLGMIAFVVAVCAVAATAVRTSVAASGAGCNCLDIYRPVLCRNGIVYPNDCYARCAGQRNCVPAGAI